MLHVLIFKKANTPAAAANSSNRSNAPPFTHSLASLAPYQHLASFIHAIFILVFVKKNKKILSM